MAIPTTQSAGDKLITYTQAVIDTVYYLPVPVTGRIKEFSGVLGAALTGADETYTLAYAPPDSTTYVNITGAAFTFANSGSAAGNVQAAAVAPSTTAYVAKGGSLRVTPSGGGGGAVPIGMAIRVGN